MKIYPPEVMTSAPEKEHLDQLTERIDSILASLRRSMLAAKHWEILTGQ